LSSVIDYSLIILIWQLYYWMFMQNMTHSAITLKLGEKFLKWIIRRVNLRIVMLIVMNQNVRKKMLSSIVKKMIDRVGMGRVFW